LIVEYEASLDADLRHEVSVPSNAGLVAFVDGRACGCVALDALDAATGVVKRLYVQPVFRKLGVARVLMDTLFDVARERGYVRLVLDTNRDRMPAAYRLYRTLGFEECAPYGDVRYACPTFMELKL
jgi:GNAT superfamily N-acetyltransferase